MPFIHIKSLPFDRSFNVASVLEGLSEDFARETGTGLQHVTATWEVLPSGHYAVAGKTESHQPENSHPVLVDLFAPDFNSPAKVEKMLNVVASSISKLAKIPVSNIFISYRQAHSGMVFDAGKIEHW